MIKKILLPVDGSEFSEKALPYAIEMGQKLGAELTLLWVLQPLVVMSDYGAATYQQIVMLEETEAKTYLNTILTKLMNLGLSVQTKIIEGAVADSIIEMACDNNIDLIVMSTHGRSGFSRWVYGSVATKVLQHAPCPVFLVRVKRGDCKE